MDVTWLVGIVAIFVGIGVIAVVRRDDPWQSAARTLDLKITRTVPDLLPHLEGMINGLPVRVQISPEFGPGVHYTVFYPPLGVALKLQRETTITRTLGQLGETDTQVGARAFDDSFRVNTSRPDALRDMMSTGLRRTLVRLIESYPQIVIADGSMILATDTTEPTEEELTGTITEIANAAQQLVARRPPPLQRPQPRASMEPTHEPTEEPSDPELRRKAPDKTKEPSETPTAPDAEPTITPPTAPAPPQAPPPVPVSTGLPDGFFEEVFGANRLSFETDGSFDDQIRGTTVKLSGVIKQAREQADDATGRLMTKATITVAQIDNDLYGKTDVDAIVLLPAGTASGLERGDEVTFEGTVDGADAFMRNLFIGEGKLID